MTMIGKICGTIGKAARLLAQPDVAFFALPPLMLLLVAGTVAQRFMGLYDAQKMFFSSLILWAGPIPLPGGAGLVALITLGLAVKFLTASEWNLRKAGINLAHLGVLVLMTGGLLTVLTAREGFMVIPEGQSASFISDYHRRDLLLSRDGAVIADVPHTRIAAGRSLSFENAPLRIAVREACRNCAIVRREESKAAYSGELRGMARFMALQSAPLEKQDEANLYGATIELSGAGDKQDGTHVIFDAMPKPIRVTLDGHVYELIYGKRQTPLPFALKLESFEKTVYPGTDKAKSYRSDLTVMDGAAAWPVRIEMNKPLRYKGYTFFQSSFIESEAGAATVLAAVRNGGWLFPYIGTAIITLGLLLHVVVTARAGRRGG